ncbi:MAG TPA: hypothetical protein VIU64_09080, partial [Polyangia bacterium]
VYLMCDDVGAFVAAMATRAITCTTPVDRGWGILTELTLPGGGKVGVYQPRHARPAPATAPARQARSRKTARKTSKARGRAAAPKKAPPKRKAALTPKSKRSKRR